jgi:hypothetical protein
VPSTDRVVAAEARLVHIPVEPPRGDVIQKFTALYRKIGRLHWEGGDRERAGARWRYR